MTRKTSLCGAMLAVVVAASACGGGASGTNLPGTKEFGLTEADYVAHVERTQALIADCMKRAGFEYIPVDVATIEKAQESVRQEPGLSRRQYKEKWGFSVTTRFDDPVRTIGLGPNVQIMQRLPAADREAYEITLFGQGHESDFAFTLDEEDFSATGGCTREAVSQVFTPDQLQGTYVNPKDVLVQEDPRIKEAQTKWTQCMQDKGYNYRDDQDLIIEDLAKRLDTLLEGADPQSLTGERLTALKALQADETMVAVADLDCQEKHTDAIVRKVEEEVFGRRVSG